MTSDRLYSVIVPVYNAESTLSRCVDSILAQTYGNFELILVDDGSRDRSGEIIDQYAAKDPRVIAIHKTNGGVSSARNAGLDRAQGEYVAFVDADDYITPPYLSEFQRNSEDLIIGGFKTFGYPIDGEVPEELFVTEKRDKLIFLEKNFGKPLVRTPWAKIFNRKVIENNNLKFNEGMRLGEDTKFVLEFISCCNSISSVQNQSYLYFVQENRMKDYRLKAKEYAECIDAIENALMNIGSRHELRESIRVIRQNFKYTFETGLWFNGDGHARVQSLEWFKYKLWKYLPEESILSRFRRSVVMFLWPLLYRNMIRKNSCN